MFDTGTDQLLTLEGRACANLLLAPRQSHGKLSPRAQGWSQPCMVLVLSSMTCDTLIGNDFLYGETCKTGEGGVRKGAGRW